MARDTTMSSHPRLRQSSSPLERQQLQLPVETRPPASRPTLQQLPRSGHRIFWTNPHGKLQQWREYCGTSLAQTPSSPGDPGAPWLPGRLGAASPGGLRSRAPCADISMGDAQELGIWRETTRDFTNTLGISPTKLGLWLMTIHPIRAHWH